VLHPPSLLFHFAVDVDIPYSIFDIDNIDRHGGNRRVVAAGNYHLISITWIIITIDAIIAAEVGAEAAAVARPLNTAILMATTPSEIIETIIFAAIIGIIKTN
jgi:hypothetical protein